MIFLFEVFAHLGWGERCLTEQDFYRICRREKIAVIEYPLSGVSGCYMASGGRRIITIDSRLRGVRKLHVAFHELAHHFLHAPASGATVNFFHLREEPKVKFEAEAFAAVALLPEPALRRMLVAAPEEWEPGFTQEMVEFRLKVLELYGV